MHSALIGFGLGFLVALQLGPMSLFLIRSTLRAGWRVGLAIGAGIAVVDGLYAAAGATGIAPLLAFQPVRLGLGLTGAAVLLWLGVRTLTTAFRMRIGAESPAEVATPVRAFLAAIGDRALRIADVVAGLGLLGFGGALAYATAHDR